MLADSGVVGIPAHVSEDVDCEKHVVGHECRPRLAEKTIDGSNPILQGIRLAVDEPRGIWDPSVVELNLVEASIRHFTCDGDVVGSDLRLVRIRPTQPFPRSR